MSQGTTELSPPLYYDLHEMKEIDYEYQRYSINSVFFYMTFLIVVILIIIVVIVFVTKRSSESKSDFEPSPHPMQFSIHSNVTDHNNSLTTMSIISSPPVCEMDQSIILHFASVVPPSKELVVNIPPILNYVTETIKIRNCFGNTLFEALIIPSVPKIILFAIIPLPNNSSSRIELASMFKSKNKIADNSSSLLNGLKASIDFLSESLTSPSIPSTPKNGSSEMTSTWIIAYGTASVDSNRSKNRENEPNEIHFQSKKSNEIYNAYKKRRRHSIPTNDNSMNRVGGSKDDVIHYPDHMTIQKDQSRRRVTFPSPPPPFSPAPPPFSPPHLPHTRRNSSPQYSFLNKSQNSPSNSTTSRPLTQLEKYGYLGNEDENISHDESRENTPLLPHSAQKNYQFNLNEEREDGSASSKIYGTIIVKQKNDFISASLFKNSVENEDPQRVLYCSKTHQLSVSPSPNFGELPPLEMEKQSTKTRSCWLTGSGGALASVSGSFPLRYMGDARIQRQKGGYDVLIHEGVDSTAIVLINLAIDFDAS